MRLGGGIGADGFLRVLFRERKWTWNECFQISFCEGARVDCRYTKPSVDVSLFTSSAAVAIPDRSGSEQFWTRLGSWRIIGWRNTLLMSWIPFEGTIKWNMPLVLSPARIWKKNWEKTWNWLNWLPTSKTSAVLQVAVLCRTRGVECEPSVHPVGRWKLHHFCPLMNLGVMDIVMACYGLLWQLLFLCFPALSYPYYH